MIIVKDYKFYAAHRNEELDDKCRNIHGHRYGLRCHFRVKRTCSYSTLFATFDDKIEPHLKEHYDHGMLIHVSDPLYATLQDHMRRTGETFKLKCLDGPTSVENLAYKLFEEILDMGFDLDRIEVRETDTSVVVYTADDWRIDRQQLSSTSASVRSQNTAPQSGNDVDPAKLSDQPATSSPTVDPHGAPVNTPR